jgi:hypothetical protein
MSGAPGQVLLACRGAVFYPDLFFLQSAVDTLDIPAVWDFQNQESPHPENRIKG